LARAIERLMVLDGVLAEPETAWLATPHEKLEHFTKVTSLPLETLPGRGAGDRGGPRRAFPDALPIGCARDDLPPRKAPRQFQMAVEEASEVDRVLSGHEVEEDVWTATTRCSGRKCTASCTNSDGQHERQHRQLLVHQDRVSAQCWSGGRSSGSRLSFEARATGRVTGHHAHHDARRPRRRPRFSASLRPRAPHEARPRPRRVSRASATTMGETLTASRSGACPWQLRDGRQCAGLAGATRARRPVDSRMCLTAARMGPAHGQFPEPAKVPLSCYIVSHREDRLARSVRSWRKTLRQLSCACAPWAFKSTADELAVPHGQGHDAAQPAVRSALQP
jgi:hypothetical protein